MSWYVGGYLSRKQGQEIENEAASRVAAIAKNFAEQENEAINTNIFQAGGQLNTIDQSSQAIAEGSSEANQTATNVKEPAYAAVSNSAPGVAVEVTSDGQVKINGEKVEVKKA